MLSVFCGKKQWVADNCGIITSEIKNVKKLGSSPRIILLQTAQQTEHQANMTPYTQLLYSKIWANRGIHYFLIFALKHRYPQSMFLAKIRKNVNFLQLKNHFILHRNVNHKKERNGSRRFVQYLISVWRSMAKP